VLLSVNTYRIYAQDVKAADMFTHLPVWVNYLQWLIGRELQDSDYLFPYIGPNGIPHPDRPMDHNKVQDLINEFTEQAGLKKHYTTHCFRRGGAQYRFMFAPIGQRWPLNMVRWWGGWAIGEHVGRACHRCRSIIPID
jgi:hypothetical protein